MVKKERNVGLMDELAHAPWWTGIAVAASVYAALRYGPPYLHQGNPIIDGALYGIQQFAPYIAAIFLIPTPLALYNRWRKRRLLDSQTDLRTIRQLDWREFEELVAEAYRRQGYRVIENDGVGADGGVDVRLERGGETHLVQCKHWKSSRVGVKTIREMYGVLVAEKATSVSVITSGGFTKEAWNFAKGKSIRLLNGERLLDLVKSVQHQAAARPELATTPAESSASQEQPGVCPKCGKALTLRLIKRGPNAGTEFIGCTGFPQCRYTTNIR